MATEGNNIFQFPTHEIRGWRKTEAAIREAVRGAGREKALADYICANLRLDFDSIASDMELSLQAPLSPGVQDAITKINEFHHENTARLISRLVIVYAQLYDCGRFGR